MTRRDTQLPPWHLITCEFPPRIGGISDYSFTMATALADAGHDTHVWCPPSPSSVPSTAGVVVHATLGQFGIRDLLRTGRDLNSFEGPRRLFVQWVPHGYGWRSLNVVFALWLACRAWLQGDELHVMVHEPFLRLSLNPFHLAGALIHRLMLAVACSRAARIWVSIPAWADEIRAFVPRRVPCEWLPVPSPISPSAENRSLPERLEGRSRDLVIGHFGTFSPLVTPLLARTLDGILHGSATQVLLIGRGSDAFRARYLAARGELANRVHATGVLASADVRQAIERCDVMVQPYPDGISARRTSALAVLACGGVVVTNGGRLTEGLWRESGAVALAPRPDGRLLADVALQVMGDADRRLRLSRLARDLYDRVFDIRHSVDRLRAAVPVDASGREASLVRR